MVAFEAELYGTVSRTSTVGMLPQTITYSIVKIDRGSSMKRRVIRPPEYIVDWCRSFSMGMTWLKSYNGQVPSYRRRQPDGSLVTPDPTLHLPSSSLYKATIDRSRYTI
jgi:hypothetical protein